jgi:hypothetical protein
MQYFGRNLFVMNILQTITTRKLSKIKELSPGKGGGGTPPQEMTSIENEERRERTGKTRK